MTDFLLFLSYHFYTGLFLRLLPSLLVLFGGIIVVMQIVEGRFYAARITASLTLLPAVLIIFIASPLAHYGHTLYEARNPTPEVSAQCP